MLSRVLNKIKEKKLPKMKSMEEISDIVQDPKSRNILIAVGVSLLTLSLGIFWYSKRKSRARMNKKFKRFDTELEETGRRTHYDVSHFHTIKKVFEEEVKRGLAERMEKNDEERRRVIMGGFSKKEEYIRLCKEYIYGERKERKAFFKRLESQIGLNKSQYRAYYRKYKDTTDYFMLEQVREKNALRKIIVSKNTATNLNILMHSIIHPDEIDNMDFLFPRARDYYLYINNHTLDCNIEQSEEDLKYEEETVTQLFLYDYCYQKYKVTRDQFLKAYYVFNLVGMQNELSIGFMSSIREERMEST